MKSELLRFLPILPLLLFLVKGNAQSEAPPEEPVITYNISYGAQLPFGDLQDRFGWNSNIGMDVEFLTGNNWIYGIGGYFLFGTKVKENVLASLLNKDTIIYTENGELAFLSLGERGFYAGAHVGKVLPFNHKKGRGGLRLTLGTGLLQHKVRVQDDASAFVPQVAGEYKKGYDRLSNGLAITQQVGYQYLSRNKRINFFIALEATQGFTQSRRSWDIDLMSADTRKRTDMLFGLRFNWILPIYEPGTGESDFY